MQLRIWMALALSSGLWGQVRPGYEVATVKANSTGSESFTQGLAADGFFSARNMTLWNLIRFAYNLRDLQIQNAPDWVRKSGFDLQAKPSGPISREESLRMLQVLLEDRFRLKFHLEKREQPAYILTVADRGKLTPAEQMQNGTVRMGDIDAGLTLAGLCGILEFELDRPLVDQTGLTGGFHIRLRYASERVPAPPDSSLPALSTALREQLGLKLESGRAPLETFVIDSVEQPSEN